MRAVYASRVLASPRGVRPRLSASPRAPKLLDRMRHLLRVLHYGRRTEYIYCHWVKRFIFFHGLRHPGGMGAAEVNAFLSHLAVDRKVCASTQNQALSALLFLYRRVLSRDMGDLGGDLVRARHSKRLPVVLTRQEVRDVLALLHGTAWIVASLLYGSGLRLLECLRLRVQDVDFEASQVIVRDGKGRKDRITMLPQILEGAAPEAPGTGAPSP